MHNPADNNPEQHGVAAGQLADGWSYNIERIPVSNRYQATVLRPYGDALSGGVPWPIEDADQDDPAHPTYGTMEEAVQAAQKYVERLREVHGYPDPDKMSSRGFRPALW